MLSNVLQFLRQKLLDVGVPNVYIGNLPELQTDCIALKVTQGYPSTQYFAQQDVLEPLVQVLVRTREYSIGATYAKTVVEQFNKLANEQLQLLKTQLVGSPGYLGRNLAGFGEWSLMFHLTLTKY